MRIGIKILSSTEPASIQGVPCTRQRVYLAELDITSAKEALMEVMRGRQAVGNLNQSVSIRCGDDKDFYSVKTKAEIIGWINNCLKMGQ